MGALPSPHTTDLHQLICRMAWAAWIADVGKEQVYGSLSARRSRMRVHCFLRPRMIHRVIQVLLWHSTNILGRWGGTWRRWVTAGAGQPVPRPLRALCLFGSASLGRGSPISRRVVFPSKEVHTKACPCTRGAASAGAAR